MIKKVLFFVFCLTAISYFGYSQFKFGVKVGAPFKLKNLEIQNNNIRIFRPFSIGLLSETMVLPFSLGFEVSALYELERVSGDKLMNSVEVNYLVIPINLKWKTGLKNLKVFALSGAVLELNLHNSKNIELNSNTTISSLKTIYKPEDFTWGLNVGAGIEFGQTVQFGVSYFCNFGTSYKQIKDDLIYSNETDNTFKDSYGRFLIYMNYLF
jgi:hypothetical protein